MHFQEFWDSCAQNKTSEISKHALSDSFGLLCAEQNVGNIKNTRSWFVGLWLAEQSVGNPKNVNCVLALSKARVLALNTAHVLRLNKADVLALHTAHVLRLNYLVETQDMCCVES